MKIFGEHDENTLDQARDVESRAVHFALMADGHFGYWMPVGGVAAFQNQVSIAGVGVDIACGNCAIKTDKIVDPRFQPRRHGWGEIADEIQDTISFGIGRTNTADDAPVDHDLFRDSRWDIVPANERDRARGDARAQLGTVGTGNHYVDVFVDEDGHVWVGVHFGSRGFGFKTANYFMARSQGRDTSWGQQVQWDAGIVDLYTQLGQDYWALMQLAGRYAYAGREWVARKVVSLIGGEQIFMVHNHHNYAWKETHGGRDLVVVRKGATPAFPGQRGFVGGSMGDNAVILQGRDFSGLDNTVDHRAADVAIATQKAALYSTVHGAGRVMSRNQAAGKFVGKGNKRHRIGGAITREMRDAWLKERGVILRGSGLDEAPQAYRRLSDVLDAQGPTIEVLHVLRPLIVVMAPEDEHDPYRD